MKLSTKIKMFITGAIRKMNLDVDSDVNALACGRESIGLNKVRESIDFLTGIGFDVDVVRLQPRPLNKKVTIEYDHDPNRATVSSYGGIVTFVMSCDHIIELCRIIDDLGTSGLLIIQAYLDAVRNLSNDDYYILSSPTVHPEPFVEYCKDFLALHKLPRKLTKRSMNTILTSLGGYKCIQGLFMDAMHKYASYLRGETYTFEPEISICNICKYSKSANSNLYCTKCNVAVNSSISISEFGERYAGATISIGDDATVRSEWIVDPVKSCPYWVDRRPYVSTAPNKASKPKGNIIVVNRNDNGNHDDGQVIM